MKRPVGLGTMALLCALAAVAGSPSVVSAGPPAARQDAPRAAVEVGAGPLTERGLGFVGRIAYRDDAVAFFGYLTAVAGLDPGLLFAAPDDRSAATARFTFAAEVAVAERSDAGGLSAVAGGGSLTVYFDEAGGAAFDDPASFADGTSIASGDLRLRDTIQVRAPDVGVAVGDEEWTQVAAEPFSLGDERFRFGHAGVGQRLRFVGAEVSGGADGAAVFDVTGASIVTARQPNPPLDIEPASTAAAEQDPDPPDDDGSDPNGSAATPAAVDCSGIDPWLAETTDRIEQAVALRAEPPADAAGLRQSATTLAELAAAQRGTDAPEAGSAAHRLALTAFSTFGRGMALLADATDARDEATADQARSILANGDDLVDRATGLLEQIAAACAGEG